MNILFNKLRFFWAKLSGREARKLKEIANLISIEPTQEGDAWHEFCSRMLEMEQKHSCPLCGGQHDEDVCPSREP